MKLLQNKKLTIIASLTIVLLGILSFAYYRHETKYNYEISQVLNYENKIAVPGQKKLTKQNTKIVIYNDPAESEHLISISFRYPNGNQANDCFAYYLLNNRVKFLQISLDKINTLKIIYKK